jgi:hypothetical protein
MTSLRLHACSASALLGLLFSLAACADDGDTGTGGGGASASTSTGTTSTDASSTTGGSTANGTTTGGTTAGAGGDGTGGAGTGGAGGAPPIVRFVAMGDTGKGNPGQYEVADAIAAHCAAHGCDFVQLLGDNIYDSGVQSTSDDLWQTEFELPYANVNLPFWAVLGNHDYGGNGAGTEFGKGQNEIDYTNVSTKWNMPAAYWHREVEHVEFFALDTNMAMFYQAGQQADDVAGWIAASTARWKIGLGHHPYLSNGPHGNAGEYDGLPFVPLANGAGVKTLLEDTVCGTTDLYLSGHDHSLQYLVGTCAGAELIVSGAGASTTELPGENIAWYQSLELGFLYVVIEGDTLTVQFIGTDGVVDYTKTIQKP